MSLKADLSGKVALVTGASAGFGRRFAHVLAAAGAQVIAAARRAERLEQLVAEISAAGGRAEALVLDVTDASAVTRALAAIPRLDIVVNNAGVSGANRALDCEADEWRAVYDTNVDGVWFVARAAGRKMVETATGGSIINIASITAYRPGAGQTAYNSSKAAVVQMTCSLALEWARHGIRVNALAPGYFETDLNRQLLQSPFGEDLVKRIPQRRLGEIPDLDGPLLLLASDASAYMTGAVLPVDGGHLVSRL